jgi:hypothetical protein
MKKIYATHSAKVISQSMSRYGWGFKMAWGVGRVF